MILFRHQTQHRLCNFRVERLLRLQHDELKPDQSLSSIKRCQSSFLLPFKVPEIHLQPIPPSRKNIVAFYNRMYSKINSQHRNYNIFQRKHNSPSTATIASLLSVYCNHDASILAKKHRQATCSCNIVRFSHSDVGGNIATTTTTKHISETDDTCDGIIGPFETRMLELVHKTEEFVSTTTNTDTALKTTASFNPTDDISTILLQQWYVLLQDIVVVKELQCEQRKQAVMSTSVLLMKVLYDYWYNLLREQEQEIEASSVLKKIKLVEEFYKKVTNVPFIIMLNVYSGCLDTYDDINANKILQHENRPKVRNGQQVAIQLMHPQLALQILQDWDSIFKRNMHFSPDCKYYQMIIRNYAQHATYCNGNKYLLRRLKKRFQRLAVLNESNTENEMNQNPLNDTEIYPEGVVIAHEILQYLKQEDRPMLTDDNNEKLPNLQTFQYYIRCIKSVIQYHFYNHHHTSNRGTNSESNTGGVDDEMYKELTQHYERLQYNMDIVMQMNKKEHKELCTFLLCLSDAIKTCRYMDTLFQNHNQQRLNNSEDLLEITASPSISRLRRNEWFMYWSRFLDVNNADVFLNLKDIVNITNNSIPINHQDSTVALDDNNYYRINYNSGFAILEQTTFAILEMLKDDLYTAVYEATMQNNDQHNIYDTHKVDAKQQQPTHTTSMDDCIGILEQMTQYVLKLDDMMQSKLVGLPSGRNYALVISAWTYFLKRDVFMKYDTIIQQQQNLLLQRFYDHHQRLHANPKTDIEHDHATESWNVLLQSYINAQQPDKVLDLWQKNDTENKPGLIRKNQQSYDILFLAYGSRRSSKNANKARELAQQAHTILSNTVTYDPESRIFEPTSQHFASVMVAWSRSHDSKAAIYCQQVFDRMILESNRIRSIYGPLEDITDKSIDTFVPTATHYNSLIISWGYSRSPDAIKRIFDIYQLMKRSGHKIDANSYSTIAYALSRIKLPEAAEQTEHILDIVESTAFPSIQGESDSYRTRLQHDMDQNDYRDDNLYGERHHVKSDIYKACMHAWCYSGAPNGHEKCTRIFHRLLTAYEKSGYNLDLRPDSAAYAILIDSMTLDSSTDKTVVAVQAEKILEQMEAQAAAGLCEAPMVRVYTAVMKAHYKSEDPDAPLKVENLIRRMNAAYEAGNINAKPDCHSMTLLLQAWSRSDIPNKASIAWGIHKQMQDAYDRGDISMKPNSYSLMAILNACAYTKANEKSIKNETVKVALMALNELDKVTNGYLSDHAFRSTFQVIAYLIDNKSDRELHAKIIFQRCCEAGMVSDWVIHMLRSHVPSLYSKLPKNSEQKPLFPKSWSRNVARQPERSPVIN